MGKKQYSEIPAGLTKNAPRTPRVELVYDAAAGEWQAVDGATPNDQQWHTGSGKTKDAARIALLTALANHGVIPRDSVR